MRSFAEERRMGTIELLITKPLSSIQIIGAKYFAGLVLVLFSLLPTLIYFVSVYLLGSPVGNLDVGGALGSFIGLFFLAAAFVGIGIFSSSVTDNQIIAFILSICLCFTFYTGFQSLSTLPILSNWDYLIVGVGIQTHYLSMSRGVLDTRDVLYFLSLIGLFIWMTRTVLTRRSIL
jgi:ABC-2 type transport system permease protein